MDKPYIFAYILGDDLEHRRAAESFGQKTGLPLVTCPFMDSFVESDKEFGDIQLFDVNTADFVNLIRYAEYVITDSFHGTVFSILHHKKFLTFNRFQEGADSRNSRIDSLCTLLNLHNRRYAGDMCAIYEEIDYERIEQSLQDFRVKSVCYLKDALQKI